MDKKKKLGQFYTTNSNYIIGNLIDDLPKELTVVEPFCGKGDLLLFDNPVELWDIDPKITNCKKRDTIVDPPDYKNKLVVTNPPFLSKNKNKDKTIYEKWNVGDLYKAAIKTIINCSGGILIVPLNFLCDEDIEIRNIFFNHFYIKKINIFEETVFDDTTYTICSFSFFKRNIESEEDILNCQFFPSGELKNYELKKSTGWRIGSDFIDLINKQNNIGISRLTAGKIPNSDLYLRATDTGADSGKISLTINREHFWAKDSDRTFATIITDKIYSDEQQLIICERFNELINSYRDKYKSLFLTNYRNSTNNSSRKRISFDVAYKLISYIIITEKF